MRKASLGLLTAFIVFFVLRSLTTAQTEVSGSITSTTTWTKTNSPYVVTGDINVYPDVTLTIEPSVIVKLDSVVSFVIKGEIIARGTEKDSIYFIQNIKGDYWGSIEFLEESKDATYDNIGNYIDGSIIEYSKIEGGDGIYCKDSSPFITKNTLIENSFGIKCTGHSEPKIFKNIIIRNYWGIDCSYISYFSSSSPDISHNIISGSQICAIEISFSSYPKISYNSIIDNFSFLYGGIYFFFSDYSSTKINNNNIYNNKPYNIVLNYSSGDFDATNNWWGTVIKDSINAHIYDYWDDWNLGIVQFEPLLTEPVNITTSIERLSNKIPGSYKLYQNYPNPFNPQTTINYQIPKLSNVTLNIYNLNGHLVKTLVNEEKPTGNYQVVWDGRNETGQQVSSGQYIYRLTVDGIEKTRKMLLVK